MRKKVLFIDRDGTIIKEPPTDFQVDSLEKLEFYPKAISNLRKIAEETDYELVMVTNQDGLGTAVFPEDSFWPVHNFILKCFENEGVVFDKVCIDRTFPKDNADTRKPGIGLLTDYFSETYDLEVVEPAAAGADQRFPGRVVDGHRHRPDFLRRGRQRRRRADLVRYG